MTRGPRRLMDDPDFKWETGCDLSDERLLVGEYDLEGGRQRLLAALALPVGVGGAAAGSESGTAPAVGVGDGVPVIRAGSRWGWIVKPVAGLVAGAGVVAAAFWLGMQTAVPDGHGAPSPAPVVAPEAVPIEAPAVVPATPAVEAPAQEAAPAEVPPVALPQAALAPPSAPVVAPVVAPEEVVAPEVVVVAEEAPAVAEIAPDPAPRPIAAAPPISPLKGQAELLQLANETLSEGTTREDFERARDLYRRLAEWPKGSMRTEAQLGMLQAMLAAGDAAGVESMAAKLQDLPDFAGKRQEIVRLRSESLVVLNRCEEAILLSQELASRISSEIRRSCRRRE